MWKRQGTQYYADIEVDVFGSKHHVPFPPPPPHPEKTQSRVEIYVLWTLKSDVCSLCNGKQFNLR